MRQRAKTLRNASHAIADSLKLWEHCAGIHISNFRYLELLQIITLEQDDLEGFLCGSFELPRCLTYRFELHVDTNLLEAQTYTNDCVEMLG